MEKRLLLASPHMSDEGYELEYINDAFRKNWIAPLGENVTEFEKAMCGFIGRNHPVALSSGHCGTASCNDTLRSEAGGQGVLPKPDLLCVGKSRGVLRWGAGIY